MMHNPPPVAHGVRAAAGGLTLAVHGVFVLLLIMEDRDLTQPLPAARRLAGMWIQLPAPAVPADAEAIAVRSGTDRAVPPVPPRPRTIIAVVPTLQTAPEVTDSSIPEPAPRVDWELAAQQLAANATEDPLTFSPPPETLRRPCAPRNYDAATRARMNELLPAPRDLPTGGTSQKSVQMGGVRVGIITLVPGRGHKSTGDDVSKSSFKWKWDHHSTGGRAGLTLGWEPPPEYDGMFDDMKAGKTLGSSVPDPDLCD